MLLNTHKDLENNVMRCTCLSVGGDGETAISQHTKQIRYQVTLPVEEGSNIYYAWSALTCAQTLKDLGRDFETQHVDMLFNPNTGAQSLTKCITRLSGAVARKVS